MTDPAAQDAAQSDSSPLYSRLSKKHFESPPTLTEIRLAKRPPCPTFSIQPASR